MTALQLVKESAVHTEQVPQSKFSFTENSRLVVHQLGCIKVIPTDNIEFIQASGNYSIIHMTDGSKQITSKTLKHMTASLGVNFIKTHKSFVVNFKYISEYRLNENAMTMESTKTILVSRARKSIVRSFFNLV